MPTCPCLPQPNFEPTYYISYRTLLDQILIDCKKLYPDFDEAAVGWFKKSMEYNCQGGERNSILTAMQ